MKRCWCACILTVAVVSWSGVALGQVESHCLPPQQPASLFPTWVLELPPVESQEVSAPLTHERAAANGKAPKAKSLDDTPVECRTVVRLAQDGKYREADEVGSPLLKLPGRQYDDYAWDYVANAVAWARVQNGNLKGAAEAHLAAAARITDKSVIQYHRAAAKALSGTSKTPAQM